jgi:charged multivesicular body protein 2A
MSAMNKGMNLPAISKILMEFERESDMMDMKEGMMSDAVDDVMDDMEDEEEEGDKILKQVLDEIGVDLSQKVRPTVLSVTHVSSYSLQLMDTPSGLAVSTPMTSRQAVALGETSGPSHPSDSGSGGGDSKATPDEDALQARLDALRRG